MDFHRIEEFLAVVDAEQITAAADALFMSQSSLSKKMAQLSNELGCELFTKTKTGIKLTPAGWEFYAYARRAARDHHQMLDRIAALSGTSGGKLHIGCLPLAAEYGIEDAISTYWADHPTVEVDYHERSQDGLIADLNLRKLDAALVRIDLLDPQQYVFARMFTDELVLACHKGHPLASRRDVPLPSLRNERFVLLGERSGITQLFLRHCTAAGFYPNCPTHQSRHRLILKAVSKNMGIGVLPRHLVETYYDENVCIVTLAKPIETNIGFAWLRNEDATPLLDDFILNMRTMSGDTKF